LLEEIVMRHLVQSPRCSSWWGVLALVALLALAGCSDASAPNPPDGGGDVATATPALTPTPVHIAGWQTYSDKTYAFSIQYPPGWTAALEPQQQGAPYEVVGFFQAGSGSNGAAPTQNVITVTVGMNQPDTVDSAAPPGFAPNGSIVVGGTTQTLLTGPGTSGGQGLLATLALDNQIFVFYSTADTASTSLFQQTFTQMLSTFQLATPSS
jgi:hypothetical protein